MPLVVAYYLRLGIIVDVILSPICSRSPTCRNENNDAWNTLCGTFVNSFAFLLPKHVDSLVAGV